MVSTLSHIGFFGILAIFLWLPLLLIITLITPKKLLDKYFKPPHFNSGELIVFGSFPGFFMRTSLFCRLYMTPKTASKRKLEGFVEDSPRWYRLSVLIVILGLVAHLIIASTSMIISLLLI